MYTARTLCRFAMTAVADLLMPHTCAACGARTGPADLFGRSLCRRCWTMLEAAPDPGALLAALAAHLPDPDGVYVSAIYARYAFSAPEGVRHLAHRMKYQSRPDVAFALGCELGEYLRTAAPQPPGWHAVVPVPLHRSRLRERGYNQAEHIARGIASVLSVPPMPHALLRTRSTGTQTRLGWAGRRKNVDGVFSSAEAEALSGHSVLLVDDVLTTGATMNACAEALLNAGVREVDAAAVFAA